MPPHEPSGVGHTQEGPWPSKEQKQTHNIHTPQSMIGKISKGSEKVNSGLVRFFVHFTCLTQPPTGPQIQERPQRATRSTAGSMASELRQGKKGKKGEVGFWLVFLNLSMCGLSRKYAPTLEKSHTLVLCVLELVLSVFL